MRSIILIVFCTIVFSCKKDPESISYPLKATFHMSSGKTFHANFVEAETKFTKGQSTQGEDIILSAGQLGGGYGLSLIIIGPKVGTFDLSRRPG